MFGLKAPRGSLSLASLSVNANPIRTRSSASEVVRNSRVSPSVASTAEVSKSLRKIDRKVPKATPEYQERGAGF
jgi:hypothetical protein